MVRVKAALIDTSRSHDKVKLITTRSCWNLHALSHGVGISCHIYSRYILWLKRYRGRSNYLRQSWTKTRHFLYRGILRPLLFLNAFELWILLLKFVDFFIFYIQELFHFLHLAFHYINSWLQSTYLDLLALNNLFILLLKRWFGCHPLWFPERSSIVRDTKIVIPLTNLLGIIRLWIDKRSQRFA